MVDPLRLKIGLIGYDPFWQIVLDQIGVDWISIEPSTAITHTAFSIIIVNRQCSKNEETIINDYSLAGGIALFTTKEKSKVLSHSTLRKYVAFLLPQKKQEYCFFEVFDINQKIFFFKNQTILSTEPYGKGFESFLGIDLQSILSDRRPARKSFYADRNRNPHELVARSSKNSLRQIIQSYLEYAHHLRNLPFVHKWYFPEDHKTIFTFRIDSDKGSQQQIDDIFEISEQYKIPTTWFLDVKSHEQWLPYFTKFKTQEIAVHCYEHIVHNNVESNKENFGKALSILKKHGSDIQGIAAPTGAWNASIGAAIKELNFFYSSEFAYDYDNLPSYPYLGSDFSTAVQIPIHPVCIGTMIREHMSIDEMITYFKNLIESRIHFREPICLYHHPGHQRNEVFRDIFEYINSKNILKLSFRNYADWWKRRDQFTFDAFVDDSNIFIKNASPSSDTFLRISLPNKTEKICAIDVSISKNGPGWISINQQNIQPNDLSRIRKKYFRHYLQSALDCWIKITE